MPCGVSRLENVKACMLLEQELGIDNLEFGPPLPILTAVQTNYKFLIPNSD